MALSWADRRRAYVIGGFLVLAAIVLGAGAFAFLYEAPSCTDALRNQDETGVDCGGSCPNLCSADVSPLRVSFARAIPYGGRTDVIAYVENRNLDAESKGARYTAELFDDAGQLLGKKEGMLDIPARSTVPLFVPAIAQGVAAAPRAFVSFEEGVTWRSARDGKVPLTVMRADIVPGDNPRVRALLRNSDARVAYDRVLVATVFDLAGQAIAASRTVVRQAPAFGEAEAVFTWSEPFAGVAVRVEVVEVPVLP